MRYCLAALCLVAAAGAALVAWLPLKNLFDDYKDSPDSTYLLLGLPFALLSAAFLVAAVWLIRRRRQP
jgi:hypothetical protein